MPKEEKVVGVSPLKNQTTVWVATTVVFALLFFLSSVLDMKVKLSFGDAATGGVPGTTTSTVRTVSPTTTAPAGGIASQVGGC